MTMYTVIALCACMAVVTAQLDNCDWVLSRDCAQYGDAPACGNDGVNYANRCYISQAACRDSSISILHDGVCLPSELSTPAPTSSGVNTEQDILDFFCTALSHTVCGAENKPVCASDGRTYSNYCEYDKQKCTHRDLKIINFGACTTM